MEPLKQNIKEAFADTLFPGDENLPGTSNASTEFEIQDFLGKNWQNWKEISGEIINYNYCSLPFFSPEGFQFILPAYMIYALEHLESNVLDFVVYSLTAPLTSDRSTQFFLSKVDRFTNQQREAIGCS